MIFATPFPYDYDSEPHYYRPTYQQPSPLYYGNQESRRYLQQLRAVEEAKRRREAHRYQRMQAARQDYISRLQEEEAYRQAYEEAKRRRETEESKQVHEYLYGSGSDEAEEENEVRQPIFRKMHGPDGRLYKVKVGEKASPEPKPRRRTSQSQPRASPPQPEDTYQLVRGPDGMIYRVRLQQQPKEEETTPRNARSTPTRGSVRNRRASSSASSSFEEPSSIAEDTSSMRIPIRQSRSIRQERLVSGKDKRNKNSSMLVEDASDSESDDDYKSVLRNRRPSPGEWMEPVQSSS
ncbi:MAG: hypothetical protein SGBAC_003500 [Bacillariaceae sp.]